MISRYFVLSEFIGWLGFAIFCLNLINYAVYYLSISLQKNKRRSLVWFLISTALIIVNMAAAIIFLICIISPQTMSGQGKLDEFTAEYFIKFAIVILVVSLITILVISFTQRYWGVCVRNQKIWISFVPYDKSNFNINDKLIKFGRMKKYKFILRKTVVGKELNRIL